MYPPPHTLLILYCTVPVKDLYRYGRQYPWERPLRCPVCQGHRLWGHGFARRYFEPFQQPAWVRRYRCPDCGAVHTLRPRPYPEGVRYPRVVIVSCLLTKAVSRAWPQAVVRQLQQHWWRRAYRGVCTSMNLTLSDLREFLAWLFRLILSDVLLL